jgi:pimeloyl-ACP methyl ester carboxylesterase
MSKKPDKSANYILPLHMNGMSGRMLRLPPPKSKKREILYVYGHHSSLERTIGIAKFLNRYGAVTVPDLPGFGGMDTFYKIGEKPTLDNMADYLASFVKLRYKGKRFSIAGLSYGFVVVTRMLQKYPEISSKVDLVVSASGLTNKNEFRFKKRTFYLLKYASIIFTTRLAAGFVNVFILRKGPILVAYKVFEPIFIKREHSKLTNAEKDELKRRLSFEVDLWKMNEFRTYAATSVSLFTLDLSGTKVKLPVHHVYVKGDRYLNVRKAEKNMSQIYTKTYKYSANMPNHAPSVIAEVDEAAKFIPLGIKKLLAKKQ